ncbi:MAG TPA: ATP-binding protein [Saccharospirillum sp.]|nr:ATP-binding protein [Saccharospirillum sp.]
MLSKREVLPQALAFGFALLIVVLIAIENDRTNQELLTVNDSVTDIYVTVTELQSLFSLLQDLESGERGYLLTGNEAYLEPYQVALAGIERQYQTVAEHLDALPGARQFPVQLDQLIDRKLEIATANVAIRKNEGLAAAQRQLMSGEGKAAMDAIRDLVRRMESEAAQALARYTERAREQARTSRLVSLGGSLAAALLLLLAALVVTRTLRERLRWAREADADAARLQRILNAIPDSLYRFSASRPPEPLGENPSIDPARLGNLLKGRDAPEPAQPLDWTDPDSGHTFEVRVTGLDDEDALAVVRDVTEQRRITQMKSEFISTVSHELRTPLTSIGGALSVLASDEAAGVARELRPMLNLALKNNERLSNLINDILDVERLESGRMTIHFRVQPLRPLVNQSLEDMLPFAGRFGVNLVLAPDMDDAMVRVDAERLLQVLVNLLSNAIKFSPPEGTVTVGIDRVGNQARIYVGDEGPGIPKAFYDRVFERFAQVDGSNTRKTGGTGLGLAISRGLMLQMEGTIDFESDEGRGTTFYLYLPLVDRG